MPRHRLATAGAVLVAALIGLPVATVFLLAASGSGDVWAHLLANVIPGALGTTIWLIALVSLFSAIAGIAAASLIVRCDFPGRRILSWALVLPIAIPPYVAAYAFGEFFLFTGPVQSGLRALFGWESARDYWFPDIRSTWGAAFVLAMVLYPYVYLSTRVVFLMQGRNLADAARTLGASAWTTYFRILLPVARPAIVAGLALVLMETLNDIGVAEFFGVRTLTFSVYSTWLNRGSLAGAAQIACILLAFVVMLVAAERWARRHQRFGAARATHMRNRPSRVRISGWRAVLAFLACALPVAAGFGVPLYVFGLYALKRLDALRDPSLYAAAASSAAVGAATALVTVGLALFLLKAIRTARNPMTAAAARVATLGYALPGTILGIGLLFALARIDNGFDGLLRSLAGISPGLVLSGTAVAIVYACSARFMMLAESNVQAGIDKLPPHLEDAARSLGMTSGRASVKVMLPLLRPAIATAAVLVFVDTVKELSATILLRPFGFATLATTVYENASRGAVEDGAVAALLIVGVSLAPVILLSRMLVRDEVA